MKLKHRKSAPTDDDVLDEIYEVANLMNVKPNYLCMMAVGNGHVVKRLEEGGTMSLAILHRFRDFVDRELVRRKIAA